MPVKSYPRSGRSGGTRDYGGGELVTEPLPGVKRKPEKEPDEEDENSTDDED